MKEQKKEPQGLLWSRSGQTGRNARRMSGVRKEREVRMGDVNVRKTGVTSRRLHGAGRHLRTDHWSPPPSEMEGLFSWSSG